MAVLSFLSFILLISLTHSEMYSNAVIDLSHWQETVDFAEVKQDGIVAVIHKATEGQTYVDPCYADRRIAAEKEGLLWGAYHFGRKNNPEGQADHFLDTVGDFEHVLLILDLESTMSPEEAEEFVLRVKERAGRYPLIYGSPYFLEPYSLPALDNCTLWIAHYTENDDPRLPSHRSSWTLWQYTDGKKGGTPRIVAGIGKCDRDRYNGTVQQLVTQWPVL